MPSITIMADYLAIVKGTGEGCDAYVGCNMVTQSYSFDDNISETKIKNDVIADVIENYGEERIASIELYKIESFIGDLDVEAYKKAKAKKKQSAAITNEKNAKRLKFLEMKQEYESLTSSEEQEISQLKSNLIILDHDTSNEDDDDYSDDEDLDEENDALELAEIERDRKIAQERQKLIDEEKNKKLREVLKSKDGFLF